MENWRQYLDESEKAQDCGYLYLFEGDTVRQTSFYDALNLLSENENAIETFLENWERSVDYHIEQLDEGAMADMASNPVLYLSTQAFMFIDRIKDKVIKYASKLAGIINKIKSFLARFEEKHPTIYRIGTIAIKAIVALMVLYALSHIFSSCLNESKKTKNLQEGCAVDGTTFDADGEIVSKIVANEEELRIIGEAASEVDGLQDVGQKILEMANNPQDVEVGIGSYVERATKETIRHGVEKLRELDAQKLADAAGQAADNVPDVATTTVTQTTLSNPPLQAMNALNGLVMGDQKSIELLQQLQSQIPQLQGVDISSLSSEQAVNISKAIKATL